MSAAFKIACVQYTAGREYGPNIERVSGLVREAAAAGANLISLPENALMIEPVNERALEKAQPEESHPGLPAMQALARETGAWIHVGSLNIKAGADRIANRSFLLDAQGNIVARYDKLHMFDVSLKNGEWYRESDTVAAGDRAVVAATPWGPMGLTICYDLRFPQLYRALALSGAVFLAIPAAFTRTTGQAHWHVLVRARAIETGSYVFAAAQCGTHAEGRKTYGHSLIVDPWGEVLADGGEEEGFVMADIDPARAADARARIPSLRHDRSFAEPGPAVFEGLAADGG
ncbi:MAG: carbon-nitrogen hydrolase family protein [Alphaproteobacteria bacterium]|nr:carbon-nitrogen hydrolase family protein [Alphaproteobacteria bacterium]